MADLFPTSNFGMAMTIIMDGDDDHHTLEKITILVRKHQLQWPCNLMWMRKLKTTCMVSQVDKVVSFHISTIQILCHRWACSHRNFIFFLLDDNLKYKIWKISWRYAICNYRSVAFRPSVGECGSKNFTPLLERRKDDCISRPQSTKGVKDEVNARVQ